MHKTLIFFPILVKTTLFFPILKAPAPFPKRGVRALRIVLYGFTVFIILQGWSKSTVKFAEGWTNGIHPDQAASRRASVQGGTICNVVVKFP